MKPNERKTFNWIKARVDCNVDSMFNKLRETVRSDCEVARQSLSWYQTSPGVHPGSSLVFDEGAEKFFRVTRMHDHSVDDERTFRMTGAKIEVCDKNQEVFFTALPRVWNGEGECIYEIDRKSFRAWEVSKRALESVLFFDKSE